MIAREGWGPLAVIGFACAVVHWTFGLVWAWPLWLLLIFSLQFFRDPVRRIPSTSGAVVAPAHGKVVAVEHVRDPYLDRPSVKIAIFMNVFSVHSNRMPIGGMVKGRWYHAGRFFNASLDKASEQNERNALWIESDCGQDIVVVQIAGLIARRISCSVDYGARVKTGERYGFIRFGSRVDVYLPSESKIDAKLGHWVLSGSDTIGFLRPA